MSKEKQFHRILGQARLGGRSSVWESESHLLLVRNTVLSESYRRFYFRDIQAVMIQQNHYRLFNGIMIGVLLLPAAAVLVAGLVRDWNSVATTTWSVATAALLGPFIVNLARGPCCKCFVQTSVQRDVLDPVTRLRDARKVLARLRPRIESVQGLLEADQLEAYTTEIVEPEPEPLKPPPRPLRVIKGNYHKAVYILMLVGSASSLIMLAFPGENRPIAIAVAIMILASFVCNLGALITQYRSTLPKALRVLTWIALAYLCTGVFVTWIFSIVHAFRSAISGEFNPVYDPIYNWILAADSLISAAFGLVGLMMLRRFARAKPAPAAPPSVLEIDPAADAPPRDDTGVAHS